MKYKKHHRIYHRKLNKNLFILLPTVLIKEPTKFLNKIEEHAYMSSCRLFNDTCKFSHYGSILLQYVVNGDITQAFDLLSIHPTLLSYKGPIIDKSGRAFNSIAPLQYAVWALDKHMWEMLLKFIPSEIANRQLVELQCYGTEHGSQYNFDKLLDAYQLYVEKFDEADEHYANTLWANVGRAQRFLPAHVVHYYCHPNQSFYNMPIFQEPILICGSRFYDLLNKAHDWFADNHLLETQGVIRAWFGCAQWVLAKSAAALNTGANFGAAALDFAVMKTLFTTRVQERELLMQSLSPGKKLNECFSPKL